MGSGSSTEPVPTQKPRLTESTSGMCSVTTVRPPSATVVSTTSRLAGAARPGWPSFVLSHVGLVTGRSVAPARVASWPATLAPLVAARVHRGRSRPLDCASSGGGGGAEVPESRTRLFLPAVLERDRLVAVGALLAPVARAGGVAAFRPGRWGWRPSSSDRETLPMGSISSTCTSSSSPNDRTSSTRSTRLPCASLESLEICTRPSRPGRMLTKAPNFVMLTTLPR